MTVKVLIIDDIEETADKVKDIVLGYHFVIPAWSATKVKVEVQIIFGTDVYIKTQAILEKPFDFHLMLFDQDLHGDSGFSLLQSIDTKKYSTYKILFSQNPQHHKKVDANRYQLEFAEAKNVEGITCALLKFERDVLMEKIFGNKAWYNHFYLNSAKESSATLTALEKLLNKLIETIQIKTLNEYRYELRNMKSEQITFKPDLLTETTIENKDGESRIKRLSLKEIDVAHFVYIKKDCPGNNSKNAEQIAIFENNDLRIDCITNSLSSFKQEIDKKSKPYIKSQSFVFNPLWVFPTIDDVQQMEIINRTNKREYVILQQNVSIVNKFSELITLFKRSTVK